MLHSLEPGEVLHAGEEIMSPTLNARFVFQSDGNAVLYRQSTGKAYWNTGTWNKAGDTKPVLLIMQHDGNLVLLDIKGRPQWSAVPGAHQEGSRLILQEDGNLVILKGRTPVWSSQSAGFPDRTIPDTSGGLFGWAANVVKTAGHVAGSALHVVNQVNGMIEDTIRKVPVIGPLYYAEYDANIGIAFHVADDIASGTRLDQVGMNALKAQLANVQTIAPYAETVISIVPGVGPEVSAAIGCSLALAEGKTIDEALLAGVRAAIPGGALAQAAFDVGHAALKGESIEEISLVAVEGLVKATGITVPPAAEKALAAGLQFAHKIARGEKLDSAALDVAIGQLPQSMQAAATAARHLAQGQNVADVLISDGQELMKGLSPIVKDQLRKGLTVGMAMGNAQHLQGLIKTVQGGADIAAKLAAQGQAAINVNPAAQAALKLAGPAAAHGFAVGSGLMKFAARGQAVLLATRDPLDAAGKFGFDMAASMHAGSVITTPPGAGAESRAGYWITMGMRGHGARQKAAMMRAIAVPADPINAKARIGAVLAAKQIAAQRASIIARLVAWLKSWYFYHYGPGAYLTGRKRVTVPGSKVKGRFGPSLNPKGAR